jgi:hypothetical protein
MFSGLQALEFHLVSSEGVFVTSKCISSHVWLIHAFSAIHIFTIVKSVATDSLAYGCGYEEEPMHFRTAALEAVRKPVCVSVPQNSPNVREQPAAEYQNDERETSSPSRSSKLNTLPNFESFG